MAQSFRDLAVWKRAMQLTVCVYRLSQGFPREEVYGLTSQIRRSAVSIPSNIAEGQGRANRGEFKQFLSIVSALNPKQCFGFFDAFERFCLRSSERAVGLH